MSDDLKPCPFCGGKKNIICRTDYDGRDAYAVSCRYHECHGSIFTLGYGYFADKAEAIAAWNTRANADRIEQLNERLTAATDDAKEAEAYAEQLEAKLAKALEYLRKIKNLKRTRVADATEKAQYLARTVLAELEK
jgi:Lar family restriction alleviation protein